MGLPEIYHIPDHYSGDTFEALIITLEEDSSPIDLTAATIEIDFETLSGQKKLELTVGDGITINDALNGEFQIDEQVISLPTGRYKYDIQVTIGNTVTTYLKGTWNILDDITN